MAVARVLSCFVIGALGLAMPVQAQTPVPPIAAPALPTNPEPQNSVDWFREFGVAKPTPDPVTGELPVAAYAPSDANAGAAPFAGKAMAREFGGQPGIHRIADRLVGLAVADARIKNIFAASDLVRLRRTLYEQFCYILNAGCHYSGRDMREAHRQLGIMTGDMNALVEDLQIAMHENHVPFAAQNRLLARLAPMKRDVVRR